MKIEGCIALVTGANRGLGRAYVEALLGAGAAKVYAGARDPAAITDPRLTPVRLDITDPAQVAAAAALRTDVTLLINNAGIMLATPMLAEGSEAAMRREIEVNLFGTLRMVRAFAPVLAANGGGAIVNMLSVVSWFTSPFNATYGASKKAELALTDAARIELKGQGTRVIGVYAGYIDTDMAAHVDVEKVSPQEVAAATLAGVEAGLDHVRVGARADEIWTMQRTAPADVESMMQEAWDASIAPAPDGT
jgi:NAD(P)-dependent dehydrogenase (short-subunit alcohol dehydrogenase family)